MVYGCQRVCLLHYVACLPAYLAHCQRLLCSAAARLPQEWQVAEAQNMRHMNFESNPNKFAYLNPHRFVTAHLLSCPTAYLPACMKQKVCFPAFRLAP